MTESLTYRLERLTSDGNATFGQLIDSEERRVCVTLELPWKNNAHDVSCIPVGIYVGHRRTSPKRGYELFELDHVPDRSNIEIHIGNLPHDSLGCILVGTHFGLINDKLGILESRVAFTDWMKRNQGYDRIQLVIVDNIPKPIDLQ